jgi:hypothetical protein
VPHINIEVTDELLKAMRLRCIESGERQKDWVVARLTEAASGKPNRSDPVGVQSAPRASAPRVRKTSKRRRDGSGDVHEKLNQESRKPDAPEYYARFREIMASQYPTIQAMQNVNQESRSVDSVRGSSRDGDGAERPEGVQPVGDKRCKHGFPTCLPCGFKDGAKVKGK